MSQPLDITNTNTFFPPPLVDPETFDKFRKADVITTVSLKSHQIYLYGPNYSHAALYLGGDQNGTPLIAEAVPGREGGSLGQVRAAPLELSTVYTDGRKVDDFRPVIQLDSTTRNAIVSWAQTETTLGLPCWNVLTDLTVPFVRAWFYWDSTNHRPKDPQRFQQALERMNGKKMMTDKFICSTLVWRSYIEGTGGRLDLSRPNNARIAGFISEFTDDQFIDRTRPYWVFPDTLAQNPQLQRVP